MMTIDQIRTALEDRRIPIVAKQVGLHHGTLYAIRDNTGANPSYDTIKRLSDYLEASAAAITGSQS